MAKTHRQSRKTNHPVNSLLRCFGFPRKKFSDGKTNYIETKKHRKRWFHWSTSHINKSPVRTVPVDHSAELISDPSKDSARTRRSSKPNLSRQVTVPEIFEEIRLANDPPNSRLTSNRHVESSKSETCERRISCCRKGDAIQPGSGQPGKPPHVKPKYSSRAQTHSTRQSQSHSISLQATSTTQKIRVVNPPAEIRVGSKETTQRLKGKHQAALGMSIVIVTLLIMLLWGRLCAILCTSAWFYFCPRLRTLINDNEAAKNSGEHSSSADLDLNSAEHKRRVVLEGFLDRKNNQYR